MTTPERLSYQLDPSGQLLKKGERFLPFMAPLLHLSNNPNGGGPRFVAAQLHLLIQRQLQNLLNGDLLHGRLKGVLRFSRVPTAHFSQLLNLEPAVEAAFGAAKAARFRSVASPLCQNGFLRFEDACLVLTKLYATWRDLIPNGMADTTIELRVPELDVERCRAAGLHHLIRIQRDVAREHPAAISGVYVQGSLSTLDFTEFSDTDSVLLVDETRLSDPATSRALLATSLRISMANYLFDPFQHHRNMILSNADLDCYSHALLPTEVVEHATALWGRRELVFHTRDSQFEHRTYLWAVLQWLRRLLAQGMVASPNAWRAKYTVATVLFVPVLFLEALGSRLYKRESFARARPHFRPEEWEAVETASAIRLEWSKKIAALYRAAARALLTTAFARPLLFERLMASSLGPLCPEPVRSRLLAPGWEGSVSAFVEGVADRLYRMEADRPGQDLLQ